MGTRNRIAVVSIRIILADDHTLVRAGIRRLLAEVEDAEVVAEASQGREAVRLAHEQRPDVVMMDINMPELNGLEAAERITREVPGVRIVMLSMLGNEEYVAQALRAGAAGYLLKDADAVELGLAIKAVMRGDTYLSPAIARHAATLAIRSGAPAQELTPRQREILQLIAEGHTTKDIAGKLDLSVRTVETHRIQIMQRLQIRDLAGLIRYAIRTGLIQADQ
jgi:DNA-binding NarL/FixJ family response regulator